MVHLSLIIIIKYVLYVGSIRWKNAWVAKWSLRWWRWEWWSGFDACLWLACVTIHSDSTSYFLAGYYRFFCLLLLRRDDIAVADIVCVDGGILMMPYRPPFFLSGFYTHIVQSVIPISIVICFVEDYGREREIWGSIIFIIQTQTPSIINKVRLTDPHWFDYSPPRKPSLQQVIIILYNGIWWWLPWPGSHIFFLWW